MFVLMTENNTYFVEYLLNQLVLTESISEAMKFDNEEIAFKFKNMLFRMCNLNVSVNTFIE